MPYNAEAEELWRLIVGQTHKNFLIEPAEFM